jgi:hypothetical protein
MRNEMGINAFQLGMIQISLEGEVVIYECFGKQRDEFFHR